MNRPRWGKNMESFDDYAKKKDLDEYTKKNIFNKKIEEIEATLETKITKEDIPDHSIYLQQKHLEPYALKKDIPEIPDHEIYALKEDIPEIPDHTIYCLKEDLKSYALKKDIPTDYIKKENLPNFDSFAKKSELELKASIADVAKKVSIEDLEKYKALIDENLKSKLNRSEAYTRQEVKDRYIKKEDHEKSLEQKMDKVNLPNFDSFAKKTDLEGLIDKDCVDLRNYATKEELNTKAEIAEVEKRLCIDDFERYKGEFKKEIPNISHLAEKQQLNDYLLKKDLPPAQDLSPYAKKEDFYDKREMVKWFLQISDIHKYIKNPEISYCMVKLKNDFKIYDGNDWAFEFYMGNRGNWHIINDTHKTLQKPQEYQYITPFKGVFHINFCFTCRKDTHIVKPTVLQRIRSSAGEFINWKYHEISPETVTKPNVSILSFTNRVELLLEKGAWIKCSMEFDNRLHNHKKDWLHAVGSDGGYTPTYFSISGTKMI